MVSVAEAILTFRQHLWKLIKRSDIIILLKYKKCTIINYEVYWIKYLKKFYRKDFLQFPIYNLKQKAKEMTK